MGFACRWRWFWATCWRTPLDFTTVGMVVIVLSVLAIPLLLRWHHIWLIAAWNTTAVLFFMPGKPQFWMGLAAVSLAISHTAIHAQSEHEVSVRSVGGVAAAFSHRRDPDHGAAYRRPRRRQGVWRGHLRGQEDIL